MDQRDEAWRREAVLGIYAERPLHHPPQNIRIWSYAKRLSYAPGDTVEICVCTNAAAFDLEIVRDGIYSGARAVAPEAWKASGAIRRTIALSLAAAGPYPSASRFLLIGARAATS